MLGVVVYSGYYLYVEATKRAEGDTAKVISPRYYGYGEQCIEFYYHMFGYHVGILKVFTVVSNLKMCQSVVCLQ